MFLSFIDIASANPWDVYVYFSHLVVVMEV